MLVGVAVERHYQCCQLTWYWPVTAALHLQRGGINLSNNNDNSNLVLSDRPMANLPLGAPPADQSIPVITQSDPLITSNSFSSSGTEGEVVAIGNTK